ncbi:acylphosphatase [Ornithinibacillus sp. L9]|uniref:Acylphosphatase n=1 Tax=Ornithinibacillus caprae TaxID=2678566 RepID=A0A6N8FM35_9BACI|nr:acylphosphatase [Ornithinibacillus caprae]MUK90700.1 acylphosphatase [Ornithinibacillus caprae]
MRIHGIVSGKVQGVGFRYSTKLQADKYNLTGWVKNRDDGTVELEVEGDQMKIDLLLNDIKKGFHPFMQVNNIKTTILNHTGYKDFQILN